MSLTRSGGTNINAKHAVLHGNTAGRDHVTITITVNGYAHGGVGIPDTTIGEQVENIRIVNKKGYKPDELRGLQVVGDSMNCKDGPRDGDIVIAKVMKDGEIPKNGSMVVAWYPGLGDPVVKYFFFDKKSNEVFLKPANLHYDVVRLPADEVLIQGTVVEVIRGFRSP